MRSRHCRAGHHTTTSLSATTCGSSNGVVVYPTHCRRNWINSRRYPHRSSYRSYSTKLMFENGMEVEFWYWMAFRAAGNSLKFSRHRFVSGSYTGASVRLSFSDKFEQLGGPKLFLRLDCAKEVAAARVFQRDDSTRDATTGLMFLERFGEYEREQPAIAAHYRAIGLSLNVSLTLWFVYQRRLIP